MSDLVAIAYPDQAAVERAREKLRSAVNDGLIAVDDVVEMSRDEDGTLRVQQSSSGTAAIATGGAVVGGLIGLMFMAPLFGMAVGAVTTGGMWSSMFGDVNVSKKFVKELSENLRPGGAALIILVREMEPETVFPHIQEPGRVIRTSLSQEVEDQLDAALASASATRSKDVG